MAIQSENLEKLLNKVTAFQETPDDIHYPSEKLVKDSLDGKQSTLGFINVKTDCGAVGDGVADDTDAITNGNTLATSLGWTLVFPPGTYKHTSTITFTCNVIGIGMPRIMSVGDIISVILTKSYGYFKEITIYPDGTGSGANDGLQLKGAARTLIENVYVHNCGNDGISFDSTSNSNNLLQLNNVQCRLNGRDGIRAATGNNNNACLFNNIDVSSNTGNGFTASGYFAANTFNNLVCQNNTGRGIYFTGSNVRNNIGTTYVESNTAGDIEFDADAHSNMVWLSNDGSSKVDNNGTNTILSSASGASQRFGFDKIDAEVLRIIDIDYVGQLLFKHVGDRAFELDYLGSSSVGALTLDKGTAPAINFYVEGKISAEGNIEAKQGILTNDTTESGLIINQNEVLAVSKYGLYVYSNAVQVNSPLVKFHLDNASSAYDVFQVINDGTLTCINTNQTGVLAVSNYILRLYSNAVQVNSPLGIIIQDHASSTTDCLELDNDGSGSGLYIHSDGVLGSGKYGLYVYSNAAQVTSVLAYFLMDNASSTQANVYMKQDGNGDCLVVNQTGVLAASEYGLEVFSTAVQINSQLVYFLQDHASSTADVTVIDNDGTGNALLIRQDGVSAVSKYGLYVYSNAVQVNTPLAFFIMDNASSTTPVLSLDNNGLGAALSIDSDGTHASTPVIGILIDVDNGNTGDQIALDIDQVDEAKSYFARFNATTAWISTKSPETDAEAGFIKIMVGTTPFFIPYYAAS